MKNHSKFDVSMKKHKKGTYVVRPKDCSSFLDAAVNGFIFCFPTAYMVFDGEWCYFYQPTKKLKLKSTGSCNPNFAWHNLEIKKIKREIIKRGRSFVLDGEI